MKRQLSLKYKAEGTPSFDRVSIKNHDLEGSEIVIRFHYFSDGGVDLQAVGVLTGFYQWEVKKLETSNKRFSDMGYLGNIGSRAKFQIQDYDYYLVESQF